MVIRSKFEILERYPSRDIATILNIQSFEFDIHVMFSHNYNPLIDFHLEINKVI